MSQRGTKADLVCKLRYSFIAAQLEF